MVRYGIIDTEDERLINRCRNEAQESSSDLTSAPVKSSSGSAKESSDSDALDSISQSGSPNEQGEQIPENHRSKSTSEYLAKFKRIALRDHFRITSSVERVTQRKRKMGPSYAAVMANTKHRASKGTKEVIGVDTNPYKRFLDTGKGKETSDQEIKAALQQVDVKEDKNMKIVELKVDRDLIAGQVHRLSEKAVLVYIPDARISASKEEAAKWTATVIEQGLGVAVEQTRWLNNSTFLIVPNCAHERQIILANTPLYFGYTMVLTVKWETGIDIVALQKLQTTVWIDLINLDPILEPIAESIIQEAGRVLHSSITTSLSMYANVRACILIDDTKERVDWVKARISEDVVTLVKIHYRDEAEKCSCCLQKGHSSKF
jgi:hypothetical protein